MGKNPALKILKKQVRTAEGWLRLLWECPLPNMAHVVYCPGCDRVRSFGPLPAGQDITRCWSCRELVRVLDESFFRALSKFLKYSHQKDKTMFARVKAEFPDPFLNGETKRLAFSFPDLEGSLAWVTRAWTRALKPRGRPQKTQQHLLIASWIEFLTAPRVILEIGADGSPRRQCIKPVMTFEDALEVLQGNYPLGDRIRYTLSGHPRKFGGLDHDRLAQIHKGFERTALERLGVVPSLELREVQRIMRWYGRWREANSRIQGNKVREE